MIADGEAAEVELVDRLGPLVRSVYRSVAAEAGYTPSPEVEEAARDGGRLGIIKAIRRYDPEHIGSTGTPVKFQTYAAFWVRREIAESTLAFRSPAVTFTPRKYRDCRVKDPERFVALLSCRDAGDAPNDGPALAERLVDTRTAPDDEARDRVDLVAAALRRLPARDAEVLRRVYGLDGRTPDTLAGAGRGLGISRERARQIHDRAIDSARIALLTNV